MRRFLTLVCLLCLAIPAGISISGCTRNPAANYCNGAGYGMKITDVASITLQPATTGISMAYANAPVEFAFGLTCKGTTASAGSYTYGTTNNQLVTFRRQQHLRRHLEPELGRRDPQLHRLHPAESIAFDRRPALRSGTTSRPPHRGVTSNPVEVFVHAAVTSVSLVTEPVSGSAQQCFSQGTAATLDGRLAIAERPRVAHPALYSFALRPASRSAPTPRAIRAAATPASICVLWECP